MAPPKPIEVPTLDELNAKLASLGISQALPVFEQASPNVNPVDVYRCYIADALAPVTGVDREVIYPGLEWTQGSAKGDLVLAVPRLRLKGKPQELAQEFAAKVGFDVFLFFRFGWRGGGRREMEYVLMVCVAV